MPKCDQLSTLVGTPVTKQPPPIEVYGMGAVQKIRDEVSYLVQNIEGNTRTIRGLSEAVEHLTNELDSFTAMLEEVKDIIKKKLSEDDDG